MDVIKSIECGYRLWNARLIRHEGCGRRRPMPQLENGIQQAMSTGTNDVGGDCNDDHDTFGRTGEIGMGALDMVFLNDHPSPFVGKEIPLPFNRI
jgi:hypothetical protein